MQNQLNFTRNNHRYTFGTGPSCDKYNIAAWLRAELCCGISWRIFHSHV
jgi:hypothetical protein